jgi:hypothetical protein
MSGRNMIQVVSQRIDYPPLADYKRLSRRIRYLESLAVLPAHLCDELHARKLQANLYYPHQVTE